MPDPNGPPDPEAAPFHVEALRSSAREAPADARVAAAVRVLSFPDTHRNPYFTLFYGALEPYGVTVSYTRHVNDAMLRRPGRGFDVLHFHWGLELLWRGRGRGTVQAAMALGGWGRFLWQARRAGISIVWTAHELGPTEQGRWFDPIGYGLCAHAADLCICHARVCQEMLIRKFRVNPAKTLVIPHGTSHGIFPPPWPREVTLQRFGIPPGRRVLLCFGDLRPRKGIEVALAAARQLGSAYHLIVAGSAPSPALQSWLQDEIGAAAQGIANVSLYRERLSADGLGSLIHAADCVLMPYVDLFVSGSLSACLAVGRAVVASDLPYFREVLAEEPDAGVLATPGSPAALAAAVERFFRVPVERHHAAARRLGDHLAWSRVIEPVGRWFTTHGSRGAADRRR
jgi:beta-1,4-mannosyltransferase